MLNRYSLSDHTVQVQIPDGLAGFSNKVLTFGGPGNNGQDGSFVGNITVARNANTWSTEADATGSWVHNKSLARNGSVTLQIRQVSDDIIRLIMLARTYENDDRAYKGCTITVNAVRNGNPVIVASAEDCYITKIPNQEFGDTAAMQTWEWTAGRVTFPQDTEI